MARVVMGFRKGSFEGLTFYKMNGKNYVRMKSSLTGKRFRKDDRFEGSRQSAIRFGLGNKIASAIYQLVMEENKAYPLYCYLKKKAISLLKEGRVDDEVKTLLRHEMRDFGLLRVKETSLHWQAAAKATAIIEKSKGVSVAANLQKDVAQCIGFGAEPIAGCPAKELLNLKGQGWNAYDKSNVAAWLPPQRGETDPHVLELISDAAVIKPAWQGSG